ncbi:MAG: PAS domain S-box protein [Bacteroidota bacterium]
MANHISVLHLEDNSVDAELILRTLLTDFPGCRVQRADSKESFIRALRSNSYDIILADYNLPSFSGREALELTKTLSPGTPFIFVSGAIGEDRAIESLHLGATDYVLKDRLSRLTPAVQRAHAEIEERRHRKQSEQALQESEILYQTLVETSPDAIILTDLDTRITMINGQTIDLYGGTSVDELVGRSAFDILAPEDHERALANKKAILETGSLRNVEYTLLRKNGTRYPAEVDASVIHDRHGQPKAFLAVVKDITERKKVLAALVESENRYRSLIETSADAVLLSDLEGVILFCNQRTADLLGYDNPRSLIGKILFEFVDPADHKHVREMGARTRIEGQVRSFEYTLIHREGTRLQVEVSSSLISDRDSNPRAFTSFLRDITERRRNEEKILEQAALLDVDPAAILVRDLDDNITFWNRGAEHLYGWKQAEVLGTSFTKLLPVETLDEFRKYKHELLKTGTWRGEIARLQKTGDPIIVDSHWTLVRDSFGKPKSVYAVEVDMTEKLRLQGQVLRAQRMESIGTLAGGIAHDLNNVLGPILLSLQILRNKLGDQKDLRMVEMIEASAKRGAAMIKQLLTFARGIEGERIPISLHHLVRELDNIASQTFPKSIGFRTDIPKDLWTVMGDATQLHQVLLNLCVNARDAMPHGGVLTVSASNIMLDQSYAKMHRDALPGPYVAISVADTGTGIAPDLLDRIFEPFFTTKELGKGTGLGLSTTLGIVKSHGGFMNVYSEVNRGTKFLAYLPAQPQQEEGSNEAESADVPRGNGQTILVADDENTILEITKLALEAHGYSVLTASDGTEAISQAASHPGTIALVVCDMSMPFMDGPATIRALRKMDPGLKFIAVSGLIDNAHVDELTTLPFIVHLQKPFSAEKLLRAVHSLLERKN